jgi:hypothetical protein
MPALLPPHTRKSVISLIIRDEVQSSKAEAGTWRKELEAWKEAANQPLKP